MRACVGVSRLAGLGGGFLLNDGNTTGGNRIGELYPLAEDARRRRGEREQGEMPRDRADGFVALAVDGRAAIELFRKR